MSRDRFSFEGLTAIEERLVRLADDVAYIVVQDRTIPRADETVGRFDLTVDHALPYLEAPDLDPTDITDWATPRSDTGEGPTPEQLAEAACRWIRDIATRCTVGETWRRFRVKAWGPKAYRMVDSGQFVCRNHDADLDLPSAVDLRGAASQPAPDVDQAALRGAARGLQALGEYYAQWGQIVLGSIGQLQGINNQMSGRLHRQLQESRDQVDQLVASVLEARVQEASANESRQLEQRDSEARSALARDALQQVGEAARALLGANGLPPDVADVVAALSQSPSLLETLRDPTVRQLMRDPAHLEQLSQLLRAAASQAQATPA